MKKLPAIASLTFLLLFLSLFLYYYKGSKRFRKAIISSLLAAVVISSVPLKSEPKNADAFTPLSQGRIHKPSGFFSKKTKSGSGFSGKPNKGNPDDSEGIPEFNKPESVEQTQERLEQIQKQNAKLKKTRDSDSDSDSETECKSTQNKAGMDELPDSDIFSYDIINSLKKEVKRVWKNPKAKKETLRLLERFGDKNSKIQQKYIKSLTRVTELKNSKNGVRIFIYNKKGEMPVIIGFCMRNDLTNSLNKLQKDFT